MKTNTFSISVDGRDGHAMLAQLEDAERAAIQEAMRLRNGGVMVTRHDLARYTVEVDDRVPYGTTQERDLWSLGTVGA